MSYFRMKDEWGGAQDFTGLGIDPAATETCGESCSAAAQWATPEEKQTYCNKACGGWNQTCPSGFTNMWVEDMWVCVPPAPQPPVCPQGCTSRLRPDLPLGYDCDCPEEALPPTLPSPTKMGVLGYSIAAGVVLVTLAMFAGATGRVKALSPK